MILSLKISKEQGKVLLRRYPSIKFFLQKAVSDKANEIIAGGYLEKDVDEYHKRQALNKGVEREPGQPYWKNRKHSQATKDKISKSLKATSKKQGWKGIHLLEETRKKIGLVHKGKITSQATRDKIGKANKGKKRTEEQRKNISRGHIGLKHKGRKLSKEHKKNIGLAHKGMTYKKIKTKELSEDMAFEEKYS